MSFSIEEKLPEGYFQGAMDTQKELTEMCLDNLGNTLTLWKYYGNLQILFLQ